MVRIRRPRPAGSRLVPDLLTASGAIPVTGAHKWYGRPGWGSFVFRDCFVFRDSFGFIVVARYFRGYARRDVCFPLGKSPSFAVWLQRYLTPAGCIVKQQHTYIAYRILLKGDPHSLRAIVGSDAGVTTRSAATAVSAEVCTRDVNSSAERFVRARASQGRWSAPWRTTDQREAAAWHDADRQGAWS
jgi:hypothetical protein